MMLKCESSNTNELKTSAYELHEDVYVLSFYCIMLLEEITSHLTLISDNLISKWLFFFCLQSNIYHPLQTSACIPFLLQSGIDLSLTITWLHSLSGVEALIINPPHISFPFDNDTHSNISIKQAIHIYRLLTQRTYLTIPFLFPFWILKWKVSLMSHIPTSSILACFTTYFLI